MSKKTTMLLWLCLLCLFSGRATAQTLEYWFDDRYDQRNTTSIAAADAAQELSLDLRDNTKFPSGFHKLNMRVTIGGKPSAVYSSGVLKLAAGKISKLEYWLDDDIANKKSIGGTESTNGGSYQFLGDLDLTDATPGYHLLRCRAVSSSGKTTTAVTTVPIMVKLQNGYKNVTMESYSIAVDDNEPMEMPVINKKNVEDIPHTLDARNLSLGEHTLKASFKNSLGVSTQIEQPFTVVQNDNPSITLTGGCNSDETFWGGPYLKFNSIPNDVCYEVFQRRDDPYGPEKTVWKRRSGFFPKPIIACTDDWYQGVVTYYVKATYIDRYGKEQEVVSNEFTFDNSCPPVESTYGCIVGRINFNDQDRLSLLSPHKRIYVKFSDGDEPVLVNSNGTFKRDYIPFGTTLTLSVDDDDYYRYESVTVNVDETTRNQTLTINATARDDVSMSVSNESFDLLATSFEWSDRTFDFEVVNKTHYTWSGILEIIAYKSSKEDKNEMTFSSSQPFYYVGNAYIKNLNCGNSTSVSITLDENFPILKKAEDFKFYFVTQKDTESTTKQYKQLVFKDGERFKNPLSRTIAPDPLIDGTPFTDIDDFISEVFKIMKECDTWNGPLSKAVLAIPNKVEKSEWYTYPAILLAFSNDLKKEYKKVSKVTKPIRDFYSEFKDVEFLLSDKKTPFDKFVKVCKNVFSAYGKYSGDPFAKLYSYYMDVTEKAVKQIEKYQDKLIDENLCDDFLNYGFDFKIKVNDYNGQIIKNRIDYVVVNLETNQGNRYTATYEAEGDENSEGAILKIKSKPQGTGDAGGTKRFWMDIYWMNGRVSSLPLDNHFTKWKKRGQNLEGVTVKLKSKSYPIDNLIYLDY